MTKLIETQKMTAVLAFFLLAALFVLFAGCAGVSEVLIPYDNFPFAEFTPSRIPEPDENIGYEIPSRTMDPGKADASSIASSSTSGNTSEAASSRREIINGTPITVPKSPVESVPVTSSHPSSSDGSSSGTSPEPVTDPVVLIRSICYEWAETNRNTLYAAFQLQNTGDAPVQITDVDVILYTAEGSIPIKADYATQIIEPGQYGYASACHYFKSETEDATFKSVSFKANHRPAEKERKELPIYNMGFFPLVEGEFLTIRFSICNDTPEDLENICVELVLKDEKGRFIGFYFGICILESDEERNFRNMKTGIFSDLIEENLVSIEGSAYICI